MGSGVACVCSFAANGTYPDSNRRFVCFEIFGGGWGATMRGDGLDASFGLMANCYDTPIEAVELEYPLRVESYNLIPDSGGAGLNRGGMGFYRNERYLHGEGYFTNRSETSKFPPKGVLGGRPGKPSRQRLVRADGTVDALPSKITNLTIRAGDLIEMEMPGGGGYGDPTQREPRRVLDDLLDGYISEAAASDIYGVVVRDGALDIAATEARRAEAEGRRLAGPGSQGTGSAPIPISRLPPDENRRVVQPADRRAGTPSHSRRFGRFRRLRSRPPAPRNMGAYWPRYGPVWFSFGELVSESYA